MNRHVAFLATLGVSAILVMRIADADEENEGEDPPLVKVMKAQKKAMKGIQAAVQVKKKKAVQENVKALFEATKKIPEHVPAEIAADADKKKFLEFAKGMEEACAKLTQAASVEGGGDAYWKGVRGAFDTAGESCQACHEVFAKEDEEGEEKEE